MMGMTEWLEGNQRTGSAGTYMKLCVSSFVPCAASLFCMSLNEMYLKKNSTSNMCMCIHIFKHYIKQVFEDLIVTLSNLPQTPTIKSV